MIQRRDVVVRRPSHPNVNWSTERFVPGRGRVVTIRCADCREHFERGLRGTLWDLSAYGTAGICGPCREARKRAGR